MKAISNQRYIGAVDEVSAQYDKSLERLGLENKIAEFVLTENEIELIHREMCYKYGGTTEIRDLLLFESVCKAPYQSVFGQDLYPTVFDKAAKFMFDFANYQVFLDGNKRTGLATAATLLIGNGYKLTLTQLQMYELTMDIATGKIKDVEEISKILHEHADLGRSAPLLDTDIEEVKNTNQQIENELDR